MGLYMKRAWSSCRGCGGRIRGWRTRLKKKGKSKSVVSGFFSLLFIFICSRYNKVYKTLMKLKLNMTRCKIHCGSYFSLPYRSSAAYHGCPRAKKVGTTLTTKEK